MGGLTVHVVLDSAALMFAMHGERRWWLGALDGMRLERSTIHALQIKRFNLGFDQGPLCVTLHAPSRRVCHAYCCAVPD